MCTYVESDVCLSKITKKTHPPQLQLHEYAACMTALIVLHMWAERSYRRIWWEMCATCKPSLFTFSRAKPVKIHSPGPLWGKVIRKSPQIISKRVKIFPLDHRIGENKVWDLFSGVSDN